MSADPTWRLVLDIAITTVALSLIIALRYLAVAALAWRLLRARGRRLGRTEPNRDGIVRELKASLWSSPIYALPGAIVIEAWKRGHTAVYTDLHAHSLWWVPASVVFYVAAHDTFYYWLHRGLHHRRVFAWAHRQHHRSNDPTVFASFSFDPAEAALTAWFLPALAFVVPIHVAVALALLTIMTATAVLNHAGTEIWPERWLARAPLRWLITAQHHDVHHKRWNANFGLYFRFWDRLAGTERA